jgi:hypothetical protein
MNPCGLNEPPDDRHRMYSGQAAATKAGIAGPSDRLAAEPNANRPFGYFGSMQMQRLDHGHSAIRTR